MSELDDELRRMIEDTPLTEEARIQRASQKEQDEAFAAMYAEAVKENKTFDAQKAREAREAHSYERRYYRRAGIAGALAVAAVAVVTIPTVLTSWMNKDTHQTALESGTTGQLTNVSELRTHGTCADELLAEQSYDSAAAQRANNNTYRKVLDLRAVRFGNAAVLAGKYSVSCIPAVSTAENLTPGFDVAYLQREHLCKDELLAKQGKPADANNSINRKTIELKNIALQLNAGLAEKYHVTC